MSIMHAPDLQGALLCGGIMGHLAMQVILNIAVVTNTIPNTGITLPFVSYEMCIRDRTEPFLRQNCGKDFPDI